MSGRAAPTTPTTPTTPLQRVQKLVNLISLLEFAGGAVKRAICPFSSMPREGAEIVEGHCAVDVHGGRGAQAKDLGSCHDAALDTCQVRRVAVLLFDARAAVLPLAACGDTCLTAMAGTQRDVGVVIVLLRALQ